MLNYIWTGMIIVSVIISFFTGKGEEVSSAALSGAADGVKLTFELCGAMCFWSGLMEVAENGGLTKIFSQIFSPVIKLLFPGIKKHSRAERAVTLSMVANLLGMSNAATPLGLAAMRELQKENRPHDTAGDDMCMFVIINTASFQLIPSTLIALRAVCGSASPTEIITPVWITSFISLSLGVLSAKLFSRRS
ncbi:MAG: spore maturation protein A [Clostridia bacterium]|nr:spore maturation protein A [Clostridia bacterium]